MAEETELMNVPSDAPIDKYRTPNVSPRFVTTSKDVSTGAAKEPPVVTNKDVTFGGKGTPVTNAGA